VPPLAPFRLHPRRQGGIESRPGKITLRHTLLQCVSVAALTLHSAASAAGSRPDAELAW